MGYHRYMFPALPLSCLFKRIFTSTISGMQVPDGTLTNRQLLGRGWVLKANNHFIKILNEKNSIDEYFWGKWRIITLVFRIRSKIGENFAPCVPVKEAAGKDQTRSCFPQWISQEKLCPFQKFLTFDADSGLRGLRITTGLRMTPVVSGKLPMQVTSLGMQSFSFRTLSNLIVPQLTVLHTFFFTADQPGPSFRLLVGKMLRGTWGPSEHLFWT